MKRKIVIIITVISLLLPLLPFSAFAADDGNFNLLDGMSGFFRDSVNKARENAQDTIGSIKKGIGQIGGFFSKVIRAIGDSIAVLLDGIKRLFIPTDDYFPRLQTMLRSAINKKFGGLTSILSYFSNRFKGLSANPNTTDILTLKFPQGHFFGGTHIDLIGSIRPAIPLFRGVFSALMVIGTVVYGYKRIQGMIDT